MGKTLEKPASRRPLDGVLVVETGGHDAVGVCGTLLAQLGATVIVVEPAGADRPRNARRPQHLAGKHSLVVGSGSEVDRELLATLSGRCDLVLSSSDIDGQAASADTNGAAIRCDITSFGASGPQAGTVATSAELQALTGILDTTGWPGQPPRAVPLPIVDYLAGTYAAAACLSALRVRRLQGVALQIEVAMFDVAFLSLNVFLAGLLSGSVARRERLGNRHPTTAAWNLFETTDGWVLICAGSQSHWLKLCDVMRRPDIAARYATASDRMLHVEAVDEAIRQWTRTLSTADCVDRLVAVGVAAGPIAPIDGYPREANLNHRHMVRQVAMPGNEDPIHLPGSVLAFDEIQTAVATHVPAPDSGRSLALGIAGRPPAPAAERGARQPDAPLHGIRVVEVGQYTSAPFCTRQLARLGADVIKIEKPGGDESRGLPPCDGERSDVYTMMNGNKRSAVLDLTSPEGRDALLGLLKTADVLIENNKPGMMARCGLAPEDLATAYPRLIQCSISGFGSHSLYSGRPGFDTVIQAMSGFMAAVNPGGTPLKVGISVADLMGSEVAMVAILAAIERRDQTGRGQIIDLSMQDAACWVTGPLWNMDLGSLREPALLRCADGYILSEAAARLEAPSLATLAAQAEGRSRTQACAVLADAGLHAVPVHSIREAADLPQTAARDLWTLERDGEVDRPLLAVPFGFRPEVLVPHRRAPDLDADRAGLLAAMDRKR